MALDLVTTAYRSAAAYARTVPRPVADLTAKALSRTAAAVSAERRMLVARHLRRARPDLSGRDLDRAVDATFDSYARYWIDSFRLPELPAAEVDHHFGVEGYHHIAESQAAGQGTILVLPHLGGWEWAGFWLTLVMGLEVTVVVEPVEPPALFEFFSEFRRRLGMHIVPLGPSAGGEILRALKANHVVCLLSDRDIVGDGVELEFFGEVTTLPAGPATLGLRTGADLIPVGCYFQGSRGHHAVVQAPVAADREGRLRADVARVTGDLAVRLEGLIRVAPEQWHLQQPNWPSDYDALDAIGKPHPRPAVGPSSRPAAGAGALTVRIGLVCPYSLTMPGGVQGQVLALARSLRTLGHEVRVLGPCDGPPPDPGVTPLGDSVPTAVNGSMAPIAPDPSAQLRTIRALRDERFDVVNLHEPFAPGVTQTAVLFKSQPLVGTFHAAGEIGAYRWLNPIVRWLASKLDLRCAVSDDAMAMAHHFVGGEYERVFNGVELEPYAKATAHPVSEPTIFFLGRHEPRKGLAVLLEAMGELPAGIRLWVGSDGPETAALRRQVAGDVRIEWLGRLSDGEKVARLKAADVFCAPSLSGESFGVVLIEAMAAATPVVASDLPGYANVARADRDALLVPPGDAAALATALRAVLTDHALSSRLVASGEQRAAEFSMERLAETYVGLYERVATRR